jgi:hypothetical protein
MSRNYGAEAQAAQDTIWESINESTWDAAASQAQRNAGNVQKLWKKLADTRNEMREDKQLISNLLDRVQKLETALNSVLEQAKE